MRPVENTHTRNNNMMFTVYMAVYYLILLSMSNGKGFILVILHPFLKLLNLHHILYLLCKNIFYRCLDVLLCLITGYWILSIHQHTNTTSNNIVCVSNKFVDLITSLFLVESIFRVRGSGSWACFYPWTPEPSKSTRDS